MTSKKSNIRPWQFIRIHGYRAIVFGWVYDFFVGCHVLEYLFSQLNVSFLIERLSQVLRLGRLGVWSGYMSEARGLSWDRKSRYGKK